MDGLQNSWLNASLGLKYEENRCRLLNTYELSPQKCTYTHIHKDGDRTGRTQGSSLYFNYSKQS